MSRTQIHGPSRIALHTSCVIALAVIAAALFSTHPSYVSAHDGGFGHSRRTIAFVADAQGWTIEYRLRITADEALVQLAHADTNGDGAISAAEADSLFAKEGARLQAGFRVLTTDGKELTLRFKHCERGASLTQTYYYRVSSPVAEFTFDDRNFPHKPGVVQIVSGVGVRAELRQAIDIHHAEYVPLRVRRQP